MYNGYYYYPGYPQYPGGENPLIERQRREAAEKKDIRSFGIVAGACVLGYVLIQQALSLIIMLFPSMREAYYTDMVFQNATGILFSVGGVMVPFLIGARYLKKKKETDVFNFGRPKSSSMMLLLAAAGFALCLVANYISAYVSIGLESLGFELSGGDYESPEGVLARVIYILEIAVIPPLSEELAARGVVMQTLRKYGDTFAVLCSAMVFAIMHGNLVQAPFAFLAGVIIGYAVCISGSIWTGIIIHFLNNFYAVALEFVLGEIADETAQNIVYIASEIALIAVGLVCLAAAISKFGKDGLKPAKKESILTAGGKAKAFILNPAMIIALISMVYITSLYVGYKG